MSTELSKCKCGEHVKLFFTDGAMAGSSSIVECPECGCSTGIMHGARCDVLVEEVTSAWNTMQRALKNGWTSESPKEEGHYLFIGSYEGRFENVVLTAPVYAKLSMAYTDETGKTPDGVVARINGFTGWPDQFSGLWYRINYPDPPKD